MIPRSLKISVWTPACPSCCSHGPPGSPQADQMVPRGLQMIFLDTQNNQNHVQSNSCNWENNKNQAPEANLLPHISQENQNTHNNQQPVNSARQMRNIATTTQPSSRGWGPAAEGVALTINNHRSQWVAIYGDVLLFVGIVLHFRIFTFFGERLAQIC